MDWQLMAVLLIVASCTLVLVRRTVQLLNGNSSSCSICPNSQEKSKSTIRSLPLAQIKFNHRDE